MDTASVLASIDEEIKRLQQARTMLVGSDGKVPASKTIATKRRLSADGRKRIAAAQRARWAAQNSKK